MSLFQTFALPNPNLEWHQHQAAFAGEAVDLHRVAEVFGEVGRDGVEHVAQRGFGRAIDSRLLIGIDRAEQ